MIKFIQKCIELKKAGCNLPLVFLRHAYYKIFFHKNIWAHQRVEIRHVKNIMMSKNSRLDIGISFRGFLSRRDVTVIDIRGEMIVNGNVSIARGVRIDVDSGGILTLNDYVNINSFTKIICAHKIFIGEKTAISWDCLLLDSDFHDFYCGKIKLIKNCPIILGEHVFLGNSVSIHKGVEIPDKTIVSSDTIITSHGICEKSWGLKSGYLIFMKTPLEQSRQQMDWK